MRCGPGGMRDRETNEAESSPGQVPGGPQALVETRESILTVTGSLWKL